MVCYLDIYKNNQRKIARNILRNFLFLQYGVLLNGLIGVFKDNWRPTHIILGLCLFILCQIFVVLKVKKWVICMKILMLMLMNIIKHRHRLRVNKWLRYYYIMCAIILDWGENYGQEAIQNIYVGNINHAKLIFDHLTFFINFKFIFKHIFVHFLLYTFVYTFYYYWSFQWNCSKGTAFVYYVHKIGTITIKLYV